MSTLEKYKICPSCGEKNPPTVFECRNCEADLTRVRVVGPETERGAYTLVSVDRDYSYTLDAPEIVVGREAEMKEYLSAKPFVSRQHMKVSVVGPEIYIENLSATNKTFVNNTAVADGSPTRILEGDEIGLGGKIVDGARQAGAAYFVLEACP
ncbi:MAG: FHA domain-containing protein [Clostridiales Family XIII bacterium]|jgi:pSer/pThr/pTyr-binding forkhead associated (FHA) protein|nr:FHA domain-containing protein [Clostridiales Family XIII bacterium]